MNITHFTFADMLKKTELQQLQEKIERQLDPFRQIEAMQRLMQRHSPEYLSKDLAGQVASYQKAQEMLEGSMTHKRIEESILAAQGERMMEKLFPKSVLSSFSLGNDAVLRAAGLIENPILQATNMELAGHFTTQYEQLLGSASTLRTIEDIQKSLDRLWPALSDMNLGRFEFSEEDEQEARQVAESTTLIAAQQASMQEALEYIVSTTQAEKNPTVQKRLYQIFFWVMLTLLSNATGTVMSHYAPAVLGNSPQAAKKAIQESARVAVPSVVLLEEYRYVSAKTLVVRQNPRARSPEVGHLPFGRTVKLLKKDGDFSLIVWTNRESGAEIHGWVFSRYLGKFN